MHKNHKDEAVIFYWKYIYLDFERAESFTEIFTQIDHRNCWNTVFQATGSLLTFSHSSVYHCHIRTESWVQWGATCKEELIKYLQFGAANWRENTAPIFVKVWLIQNSQTVLGYAGRCFSWKLRTVQTIIAHLSTYLGHFPAVSFMSKWKYIPNTLSVTRKTFLQQWQNGIII